MEGRGITMDYDYSTPHTHTHLLFPSPVSLQYLFIKPLFPIQTLINLNTLAVEAVGLVLGRPLEYCYVRIMVGC